MHTELTEFGANCQKCNTRAAPMNHTSFDAFIAYAKKTPPKGPVAMVFVEDEVEIGTTLRHNLQCGFNSVLALMPDEFELPEDLVDLVHRITFDCGPPDAVTHAVNRFIPIVPGTWLYYCYNAEYLFYPFCESRSVGEMLSFHTEERRDAMLTYVIDLYAEDLGRCPNAVSLDHAYLDKSG